MAKATGTIDGAPPDELGFFKHHFSLTFELEHHPLFAATAFVAVIILISYLFNRLKSTQQGASNQAATSQPPQATTTSQPVQVFQQYPSTTTIPGQLHIRQSTHSGYDSNHSGVPFYFNPTDSTNSNIPFGTAVTVLASNISGKNNANNGIYSQITWTGGTGFVASQDIGS